MITMKIRILIIIFFAPYWFSCSTGKKALQRGNYFRAVEQAVARLKSDPESTKAAKVLHDGYPLTLQWSQEEMDNLLSANQAFKWENALKLMEQLNRLSQLIRSTPAARKIIPEPKTYNSELNMVMEKAAAERYSMGEKMLERNTQEDARTAYEHFKVAQNLMPSFNDVAQKMEIAKEMATIKVVVEAITIHSPKYRLSSEFFYDQVFEFLNHEFPSNGFVRFYSPGKAEKMNMNIPDIILQMEFYDFFVGNLKQHIKEEEITKRVKKETKDSTRTDYITYKAKLKTFTDEVHSGGSLEVKIIDFPQNQIIRNKLLPGSFAWVNDYAIFAGDEEALNNNQLALTKKRATPIPSEQALFIEFTKPIFEQLTHELRYFFRKYR